MSVKTSAAQIEHLVMALILTAAAALCLRAFAGADALTKRAELQGEAAILCQSVAEAVRHGGGDPEEAMARAAGALGAEFDGERLSWDQSEAGLKVEVRPVSGSVSGLCAARVRAYPTEGGPVLFQIDVAWQEARTDG